MSLYRFCSSCTWSAPKHCVCGRGWVGLVLGVPLCLCMSQEEGTCLIFFFFLYYALLLLYSQNSVPAFVDFLQIQARGGAGGQGLPKYGGFGGDGGKVIIVASKKVKALRQVLEKYPKQMCKAETGEDSE